MGIRYEWINDIDDFRKVSSKWDKALAGSGSHNPFLLSDFIITWWKYFGPGEKLRIFVIYDGEVIKGGIPLYMDRGILYYVGGPVANYTEPFYCNDVPLLRLLKEAIVKEKDVFALSLGNIRSENGLISEYRKSESDNRWVFYVPQDHFNMSIDISEGKEKYFDRLPRKLKKDIRQKRKHANKDYGEICLREIRGQEDTDKYFGLYVDLSLSAFKERGRRNLLEDERLRLFFKEFLGIMDSKGMSDAFSLNAGNKVLAIIFGYRFGKGFNWALTSFNYEFKKVRPGYLLIDELLSEILRRGDMTCNCYGHDSFYKNQWCNKRTPMHRYFMAKRSLAGVFYIAAQIIAGSLRGNKLLAKAVKKIRRA